MNDKKKTETDSDLQDKNTVDKNIPNKAPQHNKPDSTRPDKNPGHCKSKELMTVCPKVTVTPQETVNKKTQIRPPEDPSKTVAYTGKNTPSKLLTRARPDRNLTGKVAEIKRQFREHSNITSYCLGVSQTPPLPLSSFGIPSNYLVIIRHNPPSPARDVPKRLRNL